MKHVIKTITAAALLAALSQVSFGQYGTHGTLVLNNLGGGGGLSGEYGGNGIYFAGLVSLTFTPDGTGTTPVTYPAYCTVLDVEVQFGSAWGATQLPTSDFTPQPPADSGNDNANYIQAYGNDGTAANQIVGGEMAFVADNDSGTAFDNAAAQIAIWDLEQGGNGTATDGFFGAGSGGFQGTLELKRIGPSAAARGASTIGSCNGGSVPTPTRAAMATNSEAPTPGFRPISAATASPIAKTSSYRADHPSRSRWRSA